jgi:tripartite-type tricarboxylate transporter receptor subunit TctC
MINNGKFLWMCFIIILSIMSGPVYGAENFPTRPLELIVPYNAGGGTDLMCRAMVLEAAQYLNNQPVLVVNKTGASTIVGSRYTMEKKDGYTLLTTSPGNLTIAPPVNKASFTWRDFIGIAEVNRGGNALFVRSDSPVNTFEKFIDYAKKNPGQIKYTTAGVGSVAHLAMEGLAATLGLDIKHIPTKGGDTDSILALLGGHVMAGTGEGPAFTAQIDAGKLKRIVQFGSERFMAEAPDVKTFREHGINVAVDIWRWLVVSKDTPPERVKYLDEAFRKILLDKKTQANMEKVNFPVSYRPAADYAKIMKDSEDTLMPIMKKAGLLN